MTPELVRWGRATLGDLADFINGRAFKPSDWVSQGTPIIRIQNLNGAQEFNYFMGEVDPRFLVATGDLLFSWSGTRGTSFGPHFWHGVTAILNQHIFNVKNLRNVEQVFFFYALKQITAAIEKRAHGGTGIVHITKGELEAFEIPLPPLPEQRKIAAILSSVDEAIDGTQAVIDQLQVVKKAMMAELLTRGIPGHHTKFKPTEIGEIPEEWDVQPVQQLGRVDCGKARDPRATGTPRPYLRVANVFDGEIRIHDVLEMPFSDAEFSRFSLKAGDVLLNEGQSLELVGRCSLYRDELGKQCAIQNALLRFRTTGPILAEFAEQYFRWCQQSGRFAEIATQTTSIAHLGLSRFAGMRMAVPSKEEQGEIVSMLSSLDSRIRIEAAVRDTQQITKSALMSVLLTGEVRVSPDGEAA